MNLADRMCPRQRMLGTLDTSDFSPILQLLDTLMTPLAIDGMGNLTCWIHTPVGQQLLVDWIAPSAREFWLPVVMRCVPIWTQERTAALKAKENVQ